MKGKGGNMTVGKVGVMKGKGGNMTVGKVGVMKGKGGNMTVGKVGVMKGKGGNMTVGKVGVGDTIKTFRIKSLEINNFRELATFINVFVDNKL